MIRRYVWKQSDRSLTLAARQSGAASTIEQRKSESGEEVILVVDTDAETVEFLTGIHPGRGYPPPPLSGDRGVDGKREDADLADRGPIDHALFFQQHPETLT